MGATYRERDDILRRMGYASYSIYLESLVWYGIRRRVLNRQKTCRLCGKKANQVHHREYTEDNLSGKSLVGLLSICRKCHEFVELERSGFKRPQDEVERLVVKLLARAEQKPRPTKRRKKRRKTKAEADAPWNAKYTPSQWKDRRHKQSKPRKSLLGGRVGTIKGAVECRQCHCWRITAKADGLCSICKTRAKAGELTQRIA